MSALCNHTRADYHHDGETCMYARDLRPGDKLSVLRGSAQAVVREADPAEEDGWMSVLLDVSWDGPTLISSDTVLSVRRPEPDPVPDTTGDQDDGGDTSDVYNEATRRYSEISGAPHILRSPEQIARC